MLVSQDQLWGWFMLMVQASKPCPNWAGRWNKEVINEAYAEKMLNHRMMQTYLPVPRR